MFRKTTRFLTQLEKGMQLRIPVSSIFTADAHGYFDRQCPSDRCGESIWATGKIWFPTSARSARSAVMRSLLPTGMRRTRASPSSSSACATSRTSWEPHFGQTVPPSTRPNHSAASFESQWRSAPESHSASPRRCQPSCSRVQRARRAAVALHQLALRFSVRRAGTTRRAARSPRPSRLCETR